MADVAFWAVNIARESVVVSVDMSRKDWLALQLVFDLPRAVTIMIVDVKYMDGVSLGQRPVAVDDCQVLVVFVGRLVSKVVAAGRDYAILGQRINHDDLVMNDSGPSNFKIRLLVTVV